MNTNSLLPLYRNLLNATSFRIFLREALAYYFRNKEKVNYAEFSRRAGFASRSYLTELLSGRKGLSSVSLKQIKLTLKLPREISRMLELHAYTAFPELAPTPLQTDQIFTLLEGCRNAFHRKMELSVLTAPTRSKFIQFPRLYQVYAALGALDKGASFDDIERRTGLSGNVVEKHLQSLQEFKLAKRIGTRFFAVSEQVDFFGLSESDGLAALIQEAASDLSKNSASAIRNPENSVFYSAFSVDQDKLPLLRKKLNEAIFGVLDEFQNDEGTTIRQLLVSFRGTTPQPLPPRSGSVL